MLKEIPIPDMKCSDEKADRRLALKILLVVAVSFFVMGFGCRGAFAYTSCDSFESCFEIERGGFKNGIRYAWQQCVAEKCPIGCWDRKSPLTKECMDSDSVPPTCPECDYLIEVEKGFK